jgi:hypothetical protein
MSQLVKLTSEIDGRNVNSNSFVCRSDDDIIIPPNSTVSLLNGHISSGILASYKFDGTDRIGEEVGDAFASLYLTKDKTDRERQLIIQNGNYTIGPLCDEITRSMNKSLVYNSTSTSATAGSVLNVPTASDFGLETKCVVNADKQVQISYNSNPQKYTADFDFTNKTSGVNIDAQGNITYGSPSGYAQVALDPTLGNSVAKQVFTLTDPTTAFSAFDTVVLTNGNASVIKTAIINALTQTGQNIDSAITLDDTLADVGNQIIWTDTAYTDVTQIPLHLADLVTTDDGTGVPGTPAANVNHAKVVSVELEAVNTNYEVSKIETLKGFNTFFDFDLLQAPIVNGNQMILVIDSEFADAATNHFLVNAVYHLSDVGNNIVALAQATAITENKGTNPSTIQMEATWQHFNGKSFAPADIVKISSFEVYDTNDAQPILTPIAAGQRVQLFDVNNVSQYEFIVDTIVLNTTTYTIEAQPGSLICISADQTTKLEGMAAMEAILLKVTDPTFVLATAQTTCSDRFISTGVLDPTTIPAGEFALAAPVVLADDGGLFNHQLEMYAVPYLFTDVAGAQRSVFYALDGTVPPGDIDALKLRTLITQQALVASRIRIYNLDANKYGKITLMNSDNAAGLATATRIWVGTDVEDLYRVDLNYSNQGGVLDLTNITLMIKGSLVRPANGAYAVEDTRLSHSCGRAAFLINSLGVCNFGVMPETLDFNGQQIGQNDLRVAIENNAGGYLAYALYRGTTAIPLKRAIEAFAGDTVVLQWGVTSNVGDFEYIDGGAITSNSNPAAAAAAATVAGGGVIDATGAIDEADRGKILISVIRTGLKNNYIYLGCPIRAPNTGADQSRASQTIPWTPRTNPYLPPQYWNNTNDLHIYVCPNQASVRVLELTPSPSIVTIDGVVQDHDGSSAINDPSIHSITHPDLVDVPSKFTSFQNTFNFVFNDRDIQKRLGFKAPSYVLSGLSGKFTADISYMSAYLPENLTILLDTLSNVQTYDLGKTSGRRRSIIGVVVNSQDRVGEVIIEPANLYRIKLGNKEPLNLRRFVVSFEDFYGQEVILQSARAVINLLFEETAPKSVSSFAS